MKSLNKFQGTFNVGGNICFLWEQYRLALSFSVRDGLERSDRKRQGFGGAVSQTHHDAVSNARANSSPTDSRHVLECEFESNIDTLRLSAVRFSLTFWSFHLIALCRS
jgi:hypothetical protein